jgi:phage tail sheath protein FI
MERTIAPAPTSIVAFVGYTASGPPNQPVRLKSFADFERSFGGLAADSELAHAVRLFFANGGRDAYVVRALKPESDGSHLPGTAELIGDETAATGLHALAAVDSFNLLAIPDATRARADDPGVLDDDLDPGRIFAAALDLCRARRAFLLVDPPPEATDASQAVAWKQAAFAVPSGDGAAYFPRLLVSDPLDASRRRALAPSGAIAGVYARTDAARGVWKAPAGATAPLQEVAALAHDVTTVETGALAASGLNALRVFSGQAAPLVWGARTLLGAAGAASDWKYVPIRRLALFIEESVAQGLKWAIFEPNDEPLWSAIRATVGAFLHDLFRRGALQGVTPRQAYFVRCDASTSSAEEAVAGVLVGFAPQRPAEFVIIRIGQRTATTPP